jgi:hypothetical protein
MKLINYGDIDWLIGDEAADLLLEYSILMAREGHADAVEIAVLSSEGTEQMVTVLIGPATMMTARALETEFTEPGNAVHLEAIRERMSAITSPPNVLPAEPSETISDYEI